MGNNGSLFVNSLLLSSLFPIMKESLCSLSPIESETTISLPDVAVEGLKKFLEDIYNKERKIIVWKGISNILGHQLKCDLSVHDDRSVEFEDFEDTFDADEFEMGAATTISFSKKVSTTQMNVDDECIDSGIGEPVIKKVTIPISKKTCGVRPLSSGTLIKCTICNLCPPSANLRRM